MTIPVEGYVSADIHAFTAAKVRALPGEPTWLKPIHGTSVLLAGDGQTVLGRVRTLGILMPVKYRRYSLQIKGVTFNRIVPLLNAKQPIRSELAPYDTMKAAQKAGSELIRRMKEEARQ